MDLGSSVASGALRDLMFESCLSKPMACLDGWFQVPGKPFGALCCPSSLSAQRLLASCAHVLGVGTSGPLGLSALVLHSGTGFPAMCRPPGRQAFV